MNAFVSETTSVLYRNCVKPIFFRFDPEFVHDHMVATGKWLGKFPWARNIMSGMWAFQNPALKKKIDGIVFLNPVGLSAGFDYNGELSGILPAVGFGFHTIGTVTMGAYAGNARPRLGRFPKSKALLVNKGLKTIGAAELIKKLTGVRFTIPTGISIASTNQYFPSERAQIAEICACFRLFEKSKLRHAYYELNISCPNTFGGQPFTTPERLEKLVTATDRLRLKRPLYVKMPIDQNAAATLELLHTLARHKVDGVIFGNLTKDKSNPNVDPADRQRWQTQKGNLSGKPTWHRSNRLIQLTRKHFAHRFTIIGTGGIFSGADAAQKMRLGADLVQLITGMIFEGPQLIGEMNRDLASIAKQE